MRRKDFQKKQKNQTEKSGFIWRRRGDSNPRTVLPAYSLSRGAPYSHLGTSYFCMAASSVRHIQFLERKWRREWDSNPRLLRVTGFQDRLLKPLGHLSNLASIRCESYLITPLLSTVIFFFSHSFLFFPFRLIQGCPF